MRLSGDEGLSMKEYMFQKVFQQFSPEAISYWVAIFWDSALRIVDRQQHTLVLNRTSSHP
jgi:hypothetical protein